MRNAIDPSDYIHNLLQYIENNLSADLEAAFLSHVGYISRRKLYYDFYSITGHSVKEYIRKRRLSNALAMIKASDKGLTDIALLCGYSSHQALCKAVKQALKLTPSSYKTGDTYFFFPPWRGEPLHAVIVSGETIPSTLKLLFVHTNPAHIESKAVDAFLQAFPAYSGRLFGRNGEQAGGYHSYALYLTDTSQSYGKLEKYGFQIAGETPSFHIKCATSTVINNEQIINSTWNYLYYEWLQSSMFAYTNEPYYEEYLLKNGKPVKLKLYLPIRERDENVKITLIHNPKLFFITATAYGPAAEETASQAMVDTLLTHYPYMAHHAKELYMQKGEHSYVCGVRIKPELRFVKKEGTECVATDKSHYLVLESRVMGDYDRYADMLFSFANDNRIQVDKKEAFAVYDTTDSFMSPTFKMYCPLKFAQRDKTS